jgi:DNA-binding MarR family transcriptional regulator
MAKRKNDNLQLECQRRALQLMKRIMIHLRGQMDERLRPAGLTTAQLMVLRAIRSAPGSSGAQLARCCYVTPQTAQALLKSLENGGFIVRGKDKTNDRIVTASITPAGERLLETAEETAMTVLERLWRGVSNSEVQGMNELLARCLENIGGDAVTLEPCNTSSGR